MKVDKVDGAMAEVSVGDIQATVSVQLLDKVKKGDYVLVHAGIAIEKIDKTRADEILTLIAELGQAIDNERNPPHKTQK
jgi:hydrogenase expression/formation protein HypC